MDDYRNLERCELEYYKKIALSHGHPDFTTTLKWVEAGLPLSLKEVSNLMLKSLQKARGR